MVAPTPRSAKKKQKWEWSEQHQQSFERLKTALTEAPVLIRPDFSKPFRVQCDASAGSIGSVLTQEDDEGNEHPVIYLSRVLTPPERNYSTTERELLSVKWSLRKLRPYIEGYKFEVITDHSALKWLKNLKDPTGRLARWALELQQWDFKVKHRKGAVHYVPDALSRIHEAHEEVLAAFREISDPRYSRRLKDV